MLQSFSCQYRTSQRVFPTFLPVGSDYPAFFPFQQIPFFSFFFIILKSIRNSVTLTKYLIPLKSPGLNRIFRMFFRLSLITLLMTRNQSCQVIDAEKTSMTIFDSSRIEAFVYENNSKHPDRIIRQLKAYAKAMDFDKSYDPYKAAYRSMSSHSSANSELKSFILTDISVLFLNSTLSQTDFELSGISPFTIKTFWIPAQNCRK